MKFEDVLPALKEGKKVRRSLWPKDEYIFRVNNLVCNEKNDYWCPADFDNILRDDWEIIEEPEPDWEYIIKNKCLCWFWDDDDDVPRIKYLTSYRKNKRYPFVGYSKSDRPCPYTHCRPVRKNELNFYEDIHEKSKVQVTDLISTRK